ncbi:MAG TPA: hypothetical protein EYP10_06325 [Armatimonadetes bacterium]|nr:hypothetical protein [Armatimonadota bacterium]
MIKYDKRGRERKVALFNGSACPRGAIIRATLTLRATKSHSYLLLEEPLPSGCEVLETGELSSWEWWDAGYWFADRDVRDDKIAFFINELPPGVHKITYEMRAEVSGKCRIMPTYISSMYDPSITAYDTSRRLVIK